MILRFLRAFCVFRLILFFYFLDNFFRWNVVNWLLDVDICELTYKVSPQDQRFM